MCYFFVCCFVCFFFFFKQKTAYEMRISDWSSDVCSSDLAMVGVVDQAAQFGDAGGGFGGHCGILGHRVWWMRALAWYSRLEWQAAPRRSGFSRELFGR